MLDINGNESFGLFLLDSGGYAVVVLENQVISELVLEVKDLSTLESAQYYLGPGFFLSSDDFESKLSTKRVLSTSEEHDKVNIATEKILSASNPNFVFDNPTLQNRMNPIVLKPNIIAGGIEIGISDSRMTEYKKLEWQNNNTGGKDYLFKFLGGEYGICGTISTAIALTYIDQYINSNTVVNAPYSFPSKEYASWLILKLKNQIEPPLPGSFATDIINGIKWFYSTSTSNISGSTLTPRKSTDEYVYMNNIKEGYPVIMYLSTLNANLSPYGLHWVTAYRYVDYNNMLWFKAADNWGNLAWINRNWIDCIVYFSH